ncbi:MAG: peptidoglycan-binding protein [Candidatus Sericytochromatia bacterium]|nr:peptidoglycan-binding protein [Candidatus Tanganyikabacteria bacterium]
MAVQQVTGQQSQVLWAELRRLVSQIPAPAPSLGADQLILTSGDPNQLFYLPAKGTLAAGDVGPDVARLQQALRQLGYYREASNTGVYGLMTVIAVKEFQAAYGLPVLGEVGANTRKTLADALVGRARPQPQPPSAPPQATPSSGGWTAPSSGGGWTSPTVGSPTAPPPAAPPVSAAQAPAWNGLPHPNSYFISQIYDPRFNPYAPRSTANCGPTSLAMVLRAFGRAPAAANVQDLVEKVRIQMTGRNDPGELTNENQVARAASAYGLKSESVSSVDEIERQLRQGKLVILAGDPGAYNYTFGSDQYFPFSGGHFIVVSAIEGNRVIINDPLSHVGAIVIGRDHLQEYMSYRNWYSGLALSPI